MKFKVCFKDPDTLDEACQQAAQESVCEVVGLNREEAEKLALVRATALREECRPWFKYGEYLTVEIDTEAKTCTVVPVLVGAETIYESCEAANDALGPCPRSQAGSDGGHWWYIDREELDSTHGELQPFISCVCKSCPQTMRLSVDAEEYPV